MGHYFLDTQYYLHLHEARTCREPGASAKVTRGTNTNTGFNYENNYTRAVEYEDKYKRAVDNCEIVLTQLISEKKTNRKIIVKQANDTKYLINKVKFLFLNWRIGMKNEISLGKKEPD